MTSDAKATGISAGEEDTPLCFGAWLQRRRQALDLTQDQLAKRACCSVFAIRKIELGERRPSRELAGLLAQALEIPPEEQATFVKAARGELNIERLAGLNRPPARGGQLAAPASSLPVHLPEAKPPALPRSLMPFFGREPELAALGQLLQDAQCPLITIVGPGGIGKTRLAIEAAQHAQDRFPDGIWFVPLAPLASPALIVPTIADAVGFKFSEPTNHPAQLFGYLQKKKALLVLDNAEHLLEGVGLFPELMNHCPQVKLLVTSRERLNLLSEWVFEIMGLPVPDNDQVEQMEGFSSVALFLQSARRVQAGFALREEERPWVRTICQMMAGMPLGIELSAAWVGLLSCEEIAREIARNLDFLTVTMRDLPERHRSMRATLDHSWNLLNDEEKALLRRLSVFHGPFRREAAEAICGASLTVLASLRNKTLLDRTHSDFFSLHELIRQYAFERLEAAGEVEAIRRKHLEFYTRQMETLSPQLQTEAGPALLDRLEEDHDNMRAALDWAFASGSLLPALRLANAMYRLWYWHDHFVEAQQRLEALLAAIQAAGETLPADLLAKANFRAGVFNCEMLEYQRARSHLEEALRLSRETGDRVDQSRALNSLGAVFFECGDYAGARRMFEEALAIDREDGRRDMIAVPLNNLAEVYRVQGDFAAAQACMEECLAMDEEAGNIGGLSIDLENLAWLRLLLGDLEAARSGYQRSLELRQRIGAREGIAKCLEGLALVEMSRPAGAAAGARIYGAAETLRASTGVPLEESQVLNYRPFLERGREALGGADWEKALQEGRRIETEEAIRLAKNM